MLPELDPLALRALQAIARAIGPREDAVLHLHQIPEGIERYEVELLAELRLIEVSRCVTYAIVTEQGRPPTPPILCGTEEDWGTPSRANTRIGPWVHLWGSLRPTNRTAAALRLTNRGRHALRLAATTPPTIPAPTPAAEAGDIGENKNDPWLDTSQVAEYLHINGPALRKRLKNKHANDKRAKKHGGKWSVRCTLLAELYPPEWGANGPEMLKKLGYRHLAAGDSRHPPLTSP
ncbi:MAG: hypothetical protein LW650_00675 [Planctomycetaceae bacterium]|jgi:hypothetical protein|nr:hypothetical protein [Phycisphaerales bacterium]MCE2652053.1 hypothetical protein [Planctomycetaceae bacterium]